MTAGGSSARSRSRSWARDALVPVGSLILFAAMLSLVLGSSGKTLGYDFEAYLGAARRLVDGGQLYDPSISATGGYEVYLYPPPFAVALVPWLLFGGAAAGLWCVAMAACFLAGVAMLPVRRDVRWLIVIVAALDWPLFNALRLGQVEPLLFLGFAAAWRWMDRPAAVGVATAIGALVKVQPGLLGIWALLTGRYRAVGVAAVAVLAMAGAASLVTGLAAWFTYVDVLRVLSGTYSIGNSSSPGAVAYLGGAPVWLATTVQLASEAIAAAALLAAWRWASPEASLQVTIVVSQLMSAPLFDHYAVLLLLPVAWLVDRGRIWAALIPAVGWLYMLRAVDERAWPAIASIPLSFFVVLAVLLMEAYLERRDVRRDRPEAAFVVAGVIREP